MTIASLARIQRLFRNATGYEGVRVSAHSAISAWIGCIGDEAANRIEEIAPSSSALGDRSMLATTGALRCSHGVSNDALYLRAAIGDDNPAGCSATLVPYDNSITLGCDPFGMHGVYTGRTPGQFWFASDYHLLRPFTAASAALDPAAVHAYLCFSYVPTPTTLTAGIELLPAGSRVQISGGGESTPVGPEPWTNRAEAYSTKSEADLCTELRVKLRCAVERQLGKHHEVGVFLSGGLDSSLVAALLVEAGAQVKLYSLDFGPPFNAELTVARRVAEHLHQPLQVVDASAAAIECALFDTAMALQQPFGDAVTVPLYLLGRAAARDVEVVFNGEFGDQLFGGWANKPMIAAEMYGGLGYNRLDAYMATFHRFYGETQRLYTPEFASETACADISQWVRPALDETNSRGLLQALRIANLRLKGAQNIGPRARQLASASGLQMRSPFCDRELAAWALACPPGLFLRGACEKFLLKQVAESYLPLEVVWRDKRGMGAPATDWCLGGLRDLIASVLGPSRLRKDGRFRPEAVQALRDGIDHPGEFRTRRLGEKLWCLFVLHAWMDVH